ncbi:hypothetical protein, partial [Nostoc sp. 'Peltigera membranacea cyanobiont' 213]|uniref:hypothetical protein n=2 Tax=unclassified Nostoc TaxID=2593658 RepID=UPI001CB8FCE8
LNLLKLQLQMRQLTVMAQLLCCNNPPDLKMGVGVLKMTISQSVSLWGDSQRKRSPYKNLDVLAISRKLAGSSIDASGYLRLIKPGIISW